MKKTPLQRIACIDVFRALTMTLMLFVNDIPGIKDIPHWLLHAHYDEDMLGFSDTIFPAFLFIMGMSIPFAVQSRFRRGDNIPRIIVHVLGRTLALIVMGLFTVNYESLGSLSIGITKGWYCIIMIIAFFLIWAVYPKTNDWKKYLFIGMKVTGIALLVFLFIIYRGEGDSSFGIRWWGILGLIGWTYIVCSAIYLITHGNFKVNAAVWLLMIILMMLHHSEFISLNFIPSDFTLHVFGFSGVLTSLIIQKYADRYKPARFIYIMCILGVVMLVGGLISHSYWIISKIQATPSWFFYCMTLFFPLLAFFYWLADVKQKKEWFDLIKPAGTATLTCYLIPYIWYSIMDILSINYPPVLNSGTLGLLRSAIFSLLIVCITGLLVKNKIKLKI